MNQTMTPSGTPIIEMTGEERHAFLDKEVRATLGISAADFVEKVRRSEVDWNDPDAFYVAGILGIGQNGHHPNAA